MIKIKELEKILKNFGENIDYPHLSRIINDLAQGLTAEQIMTYANPALNENQMSLISYGFKSGFSMEQVMVYASPKFTGSQMKQIIRGFDKGLTIEQVKTYANPRYSGEKMKKMAAIVKNNTTSETIKKLYVVQMEETITEGDSTEAVQIWEDFFSETENLEEAKKNADELLEKIKAHKVYDVSEIFEVSDTNHNISVCIAVYKEGDSSILDVLDVRTLTPSEWNVTCGTCGAYCTEGTCYKYGHRVNEEQIAESCWHE